MRQDGFNVIRQLAALRRYARSLTGDETNAEDLVHDTLVRAYEKRGTFRVGQSLQAWLMSILHNIFIDGTRQQRAEVLRLTRIAQTSDATMPPAQDHAVHLAEVRQAFMTLPDEQRAVLHLVAIEGLSYQEAAAALGLPVGTVMSRLSRARATLRSMDRPRTAIAVPEQPAPPSPRFRVVGGSDAPDD